MTQSQATERFFKAYADGETVEGALIAARRSYQWFRDAKRLDPDGFAARVEQVRAARQLRGPATEDERAAVAGDFVSFRREFLDSATFAHQRAWVDLLEGRTPELLPGWRFEPAKPNRLLVNVPPNHAKSATLSIDYVTYRICRNPNVRIIVVSKTLGQAQKFLYAVKQRLTHPKYRKLQGTFAPAGGWKESASEWTKSRIYLGGDDRDDGEKDPTLEALGMGGQIYGSRADLIICDDCVTLANAGEWDKQMDWLSQEVASRLGPPGKLLVIGTRVAPQDLYRELRNPNHYTTGESPWSYLAQPAVADTSVDPVDWVTLWPKSDRPFEDSGDLPDADGLFDRWTGPRLADVRDSLTPQKWAMIYQQQDVSSESIFHQAAVMQTVDYKRPCGPWNTDAAKNPEGFEGHYRICSMDPAMVGDTAAVCYSVDRATGHRYVMDVKVMSAPTPAKIRDLIQTWTDLHHPHEWVIESNAFQSFLTGDEELRAWLQTRGVPLKDWNTGRNKTDPDFGVASLAPLFGRIVRRSDGHGVKAGGSNLIHLPNAHDPNVAKLIEQLVVWDPQVRPKDRKCDTVMALWFAESRARAVIGVRRTDAPRFVSSQFTSKRDLGRRAVVNLNDWVKVS